MKLCFVLGNLMCMVAACGSSGDYKSQSRGNLHVDNGSLGSGATKTRLHFREALGAKRCRDVVRPGSLAKLLHR